MGRRKHSTEYLEQRYAAGLTQAEIAAELGISKQRVSELFQERDIPVREPQPKIERLFGDGLEAWLFDLAERGFSTPEMAEKAGHGISDGQIRRALRKFGITIKALGLSARFWSKVSIGGEGCWEWQGSKNPAGYGRFLYKGEVILAHRMAWMLLNGPIPEGLCVCHHCDNPGCCNAFSEHLFLGTRSSNAHDMYNKGRSYHQKRSQQGVGDDSTSESEGEVSGGERGALRAHRPSLYGSGGSDQGSVPRRVVEMDIEAFLEGLQAYLDENPGCTAVEVADWIHEYLDKEAERVYT